MTDTQNGATAAEGPAETFYSDVMRVLDDARVPFLVGGAYAFAAFTGIHRNTKDLDLFLRRADLARAFDALTTAGWRCEMCFAHWLAKVHAPDGEFIDLVFNSGNGVAVVDDDWFVHAGRGELLGRAVRICPPEETLWSKAFIMERERYDGADIAHLLLACAATLDWPRLLRRFGAHWRVLLSHLVLFGFAFPGERDRVPAAVLDTLVDRLQHETQSPTEQRVCGGTLLSREQYLADVEDCGYRDARLAPPGGMSEDEVRAWTLAIPGRAEVPPPPAGRLGRGAPLNGG